jgi:hypothetical protein
MSSASPLVDSIDNNSSVSSDRIKKSNKSILHRVVWNPEDVQKIISKMSLIDK